MRFAYDDAMYRWAALEGLTTAVVLWCGIAAPGSQPQEAVSIRVDTRESIGAMTPMWAWFGYDEPNYTYMKDGKKLLSELAELSPVPVYVRAHNLLTSGDGTPGLKWGSTNAYTEDADGRPVYDWTIVDRIMDTYVERKMKPLVEIAFMPEALSTKPQPYKHDWAPGMDYGRIYTGWTYPPKDYAKWGELVHQWVKHSVERYGRKEVESWYWEVWNEPDIGYWRGTPEEFRKLHDYAADGLKRALPTARIGGPHVTGPNGQRTQQLLGDFIEHSLRGINHATGKSGSPLDFVAFHAKGAPRVVDEHVRMGISNQLRAIDNGFKIVASFPEIRNIPIIIGESDPEGCAACSVKTNPENAYRNGTMYSSYTAAQIARTYELADLHKVNLLGSVTWAFEFEGQPYFAGFRDLATNGIDKPVLNVFRMLGRMSGQRVRVRSSSAAPVEEIRDRGVRSQPDIYAIAVRGTRDVSVLVWNYHDDDLPAPAAQVDLTIEGLRDGNSTVTHYRVDGEHSNSYAVWLKMGLKIGIYSSPGPTTCQGLPGSYEHEEIDARTWAGWGFDLLKHDWCSYERIAKDKSLAELQKPYIVMRDALRKTNRDVVYSLCQYGMGNVWEWGADVGGNYWRTSGDLTDVWSNMSSVEFRQAGREKWSRPGHWTDPDMLVIGKVGWGPNIHDTRLTPNEQITHISLWALQAAPLLIGADMTQFDPFTTALMTNHEVLEVNQDVLGRGARRVWQRERLELWARPLADGTIAAGLFNRGLQPVRMTATWADLGISGRQVVRDLGLHRDQENFDGSYSAMVPAHGTVMVKIGRPKQR